VDGGRQKSWYGGFREMLEYFYFAKMHRKKTLFHGV